MDEIVKLFNFTKPFLLPSLTPDDAYFKKLSIFKICSYRIVEYEVIYSIKN